MPHRLERARAMTGVGLPDAAVRAAAIDPANSCIVQAPAGSGKTGLLVLRLLRLLATVQAPEQVLAITFTRKAAAEMRQRVVDALRGSLEPPPADAYGRDVHRIAAAAAAHDKRLGWGLLDHPARLQITTIDSFCHSLVSRAPWSSGAGCLPEVTEQADALYEQAAERAIEHLETDSRWQPPVRRLLVHLDNDVPRATRLLAEMLARRDRWLPMLNANPGSDDYSKSVVAILGASATALTAEARTALQTSCGELAAEAFAVAVANDPLLRGEGQWSWHEGYPPDRVEHLSDWRALVNWLLTGGGDLRKRFTKAQGLPPGEDQRLGNELLERLARQAGLAALLTQVREFPEPGLHAEDAEILADLVAVLKLAVAELMLVFQHSGQVDHAEVALRALAALGGDTPGEAALAFDLQLRHILMDEFQDTSQLQHELLARLTAGWQPDDARTLFLVGDPMQSIYRFRKADVGLFLKVWAGGLADLPLQRLRLEVNFRATEALVAWTNGVATDIFPRRADLLTGQVPFVPAKAAPEAALGQPARVVLLNGNDDAAEADAVVALLAQARPAGYTTAILARSRSRLAAVMARLRAAAIPFSGVDLYTLAESPAVGDLQSLTRALLHPADRIAWLALLRAPWCGLRLASLHALIEADPRACIAELILDDRHYANFDAEERLRLDSVRRALLADAARAERPLRERVEAVWNDLGGPLVLSDPRTPTCYGLKPVQDRMSAASDVLDAERFFELLGEFESAAEPLDAQRLAQRLAAEPAAVTSPDATIQCMTIHRGKGLEFDRVLVVGLHKEPRADRPPLLNWLERTGSGGEAQLLMAPVRSPGAEAHPLVGYIQGQEKACDFYETGRLLYVAMTRAKQELYLFAAVDWTSKGERKHPRPRSLLAHLWPAVKTAAAVEPPIAPTAAIGSAATSAANLRRLPADWRTRVGGGLSAPSVISPPPRVGMPVEFAWAGDAARHVGTLVHRWLCRLGQVVPSQWEEQLRVARSPGALAALLELGVPPQASRQAVEMAVEALRNVLADERGRWILASGRRDARSEYAVTAWLGERPRRLVVDRTFVDEAGRRWVIDYKTGSHRGGNLAEFLERERLRYAPQLNEYGAIVGRFGDEPVHAGLYFPLLREWLEWPVANRSQGPSA